MSPISAEELLRRPVRFNGIDLGRPIDVVLDPERLRAVGLEVLCGDESRRYLPLAAADILEDEIALGSAFSLLDDGGLDFYRRHGSTLRSLRGSIVERKGGRLGSLRDIVIGMDGTVEELVVGGGYGVRRIPFDNDVRIHRNGDGAERRP